MLICASKQWEHLPFVWSSRSLWIAFAALVDSAAEAPGFFIMAFIISGTVMSSKDCTYNKQATENMNEALGMHLCLRVCHWHRHWYRVTFWLRLWR